MSLMEISEDIIYPKDHWYNYQNCNTKKNFNFSL